MKMYSETDVDTSILADDKVAILGYGMRKSGASWAKAEADGLTVEEPNEAVKGASIVMFLTPDMVQKALYQTVVADIEKGALLLFAHSFAIHKHCARSANP